MALTKKIKKNCNYFEGWYYRLINPVSKKSLAFIPGISLGKDKHAFIQLLTSDGLIDYYRFPVNQFSYKKPLTIKIADNFFNKKALEVNLNGVNKISGSLKLTDIQPLSFNLMGPFALLPNLPCYHGVISMQHKVNGTLKINNEVSHWNNLGYIETDKGHSFPNGHIWLQCNSFRNCKNLSLSCAISEITIARRSIPVCYILIHHNNKRYYFTTWLGAKTKHIIYKNNNLNLIIKQRNHDLKINILMPQNYLKEKNLLVSPSQGSMVSHVNEILNANIHLTYLHKNRTIIDDKGTMCAVEIKNIHYLYP
ncbi:hypothetical protein IMX26_06890 [Clostridium sp. 'deep sea']|uniref:tocopherol cyclase family protein n=1 Tax=Clostridium sp. 'deep sea' TaxID=2779445 RepID=UPI0018967210|nr:tocopherol cyclase family protein [Clostridium sp. 'deep sea']QOR36528.1 hypothetical protein IMX26_06890 [Clostridium sp. 'deep sea']